MADIDDIKTYLDDAIADTERELHVLERDGRMSAAHGHTALETLQRIRKQIEWIEVEGYTSHRECEQDPDTACYDCQAQWVADSVPL